MIGRSLDLPDDDVRAALYTALLHHVACTRYAYETEQIFGDEHVLNMAGEPGRNHVMFDTIGGTIRPSMRCDSVPAASSTRI